ncbi:putative Glycosyltransferase family 2 protein [Gammaproteobacteria bacterium]
MNGKTQMTQKLRVTVFTPTYNRADKIGRVFDSLMAQTCRHYLFEWIVIDDGSTDNTQMVIDRFKAIADFDLRYVFQQNRGKHTAHNKAVKLASGDFFLKCDSDDAFDANAIEYFLSHWDKLADVQKQQYSGICVRCRDQDGRVTTPPMPDSPMESNHTEAVIVHKQVGDAWGFERTEVLREFPFPEEHVGSHYPELIIWNRMSRKYSALYTNDVLYTIFYDTTNSITRNELATDPRKLADKVLREGSAYLNYEFRYFPRAPLFFVKRALIYNYYHRLYPHNLAEDQRLVGLAKMWCLMFRPFNFVTEITMRQRGVRVRLKI